MEKLIKALELAEKNYKAALEGKSDRVKYKYQREVIRLKQKINSYQKLKQRLEKYERSIYQGDE